MDGAYLKGGCPTTKAVPRYDSPTPPAERITPEERRERADRLESHRRRIWSLLGVAKKKAR